MKKKGGPSLLVITQAPQIKFWGPRVLQTFDGKLLRTYYCRDSHSHFPKYTSIEYATKFFQSELVECRPAHIGDVFNIHIHANGAPGVKLWKISTHRGRRIAWHLGFKSDKLWANSYQEALDFLHSDQEPYLKANGIEDQFLCIIKGLTNERAKIWISDDISNKSLDMLINFYGEYWSSEYPISFYLSIE